MPVFNINGDVLTLTSVALLVGCPVPVNFSHCRAGVTLLDVCLVLCLKRADLVKFLTFIVCEIFEASVTIAYEVLGRLSLLK